MDIAALVSEGGLVGEYGDCGLSRPGLDTATWASPEGAPPHEPKNSEHTFVNTVVVNTLLTAQFNFTVRSLFLPYAFIFTVRILFLP